MGLGARSGTNIKNLGTGEKSAPVYFRQYYPNLPDQTWGAVRKEIDRV